MGAHVTIKFYLSCFLSEWLRVCMTFVVVFGYDCSAEVERAGDVGNVSLSSKKSRVGLVTNIRFRLPQSIHGRRGIHRLHEYICQVSS